MPLERPDLTLRIPALHITDTHDHFVSESSVYHPLKADDLITSPQLTVMSASDKFQNPTSQINELRHTDLTYFRVVGWGWNFRSTVLDDYSRYIISWRLTTTMSASDVTETLENALRATGVSQASVGIDHGCCQVMAPTMPVESSRPGSSSRI